MARRYLRSRGAGEACGFEVVRAAPPSDLGTAAAARRPPTDP
jgi:hypothetical protein